MNVSKWNIGRTDFLAFLTQFGYNHGMESREMPKMIVRGGEDGKRNC